GSGTDTEQGEAFRGSPPNLGTFVDRMIAQRLAPAAILTNDKGDILYISGKTGKYLEPAAGKANLNVFAMAREGFSYELTTPVADALRKDEPVTLRSIKVATNGSTQSVDLTVQRVSEPKELRGTVLISILDVPTVQKAAPPGKGRRPFVNARVKLERE